MISDQLTAQISWTAIFGELKASTGVVRVGERERAMRWTSPRHHGVGRTRTRTRTRTGTGTAGNTQLAVFLHAVGTHSVKGWNHKTRQVTNLGSVHLN